MLSNSKIKFINSLKMAKYRKLHSSFFAEGSNNVLDFIENGIRPIELFATKEWLDKNSKALEGITSHDVSPKELIKVSGLKNPSEVLAIFSSPLNEGLEIDPKDNLILVLDDIHDPGNMGTIIRTADWFGIKNIVCSKSTVDAFNPKVVQATMGSLARVGIEYYELPEWFKKLDSSINIYGAVLDGEDIGKLDKPVGGVLIIGSEAHGISDEVLKCVNKPITIPKALTSKAESLNAAIATSIILYSFSV